MVAAMRARLPGGELRPPFQLVYASHGLLDRKGAPAAMCLPEAPQREPAAPRLARRRIHPTWLIVIALTLSSCAGGSGPRWPWTKAPAPPTAAPSPPPAPVAPTPPAGPAWFQIGDQVIHERQLDAWIRDDLFRRELGEASPAERWSYRRSAADRMIDELVIARESRRRGIPPEQVLQTEIDALGPVTASEMLAFFEANRDRWGPEVTLEEVTPDIRAYLEGQRPRRARERLRQRARVRMISRPPRAAVDPRGPSQGPRDAPVTIVAFSDYACSGCLHIHSSLQTLLARYPDQLRVVQKRYPQDGTHQRARRAAEASVCAESQGLFWPYHEWLLHHSEPISHEELLGAARELGLDEERFARCLDDPEVRRRVQLDLEAARAAGVEAAPTLFVNGIVLAGARPTEEYVRVIESELDRLGL